MDTIMSNAAGIAALLVAISGFAGLWWQRRIDQRRLDQERIAAAEAASKREAEAEIERMRLVRDIENERLASFKAELAELRAQLRAERETTTQLQERIEKLEAENRKLRVFGRPEDQQRIRELEQRVAVLEAENRTLKGGDK